MATSTFRPRLKSFHANLVQLLLEAGQRHRLRRRQGVQEIGEMVSERIELKPDGLTSVPDDSRVHLIAPLPSF
jgi:hypothetical protein